MPEYAMWTLVVSLIILSLGLAYKVAELSHRINVSEDEPQRLRSELDILKEAHNKEISDIKELNDRVVTELKENISNLSHNDISQPLDNIDLTDFDLLRVIAKQENPLKVDPYSHINLIFLSRTCDLSAQQTKHRIEKLSRAKLIHCYTSGELTGLTEKGRDFLQSKNALP